ncbi:hypothetical protein SAMN05421776_105345 [Nocardia farcinica]|uniref:Uncharacterized protein n=1 Tax=Nocardia farcinica TaxID=37329 RepID=A0A0H5NCW7_NOCFR|nr:hypothetical protein CJ469_01880 [Nocardia farcinica]PFX10164.1 hypothetical protein CJ468_01011 [Nocardia farcinica]CRY73685.1 Uncharacterised protein [Nocardia farcinica]SIT24794.1 hypothetical protein SAMN05421776_105345 [Nocardia farcinica]
MSLLALLELLMHYPIRTLEQPTPRYTTPLEVWTW